MKHKNKLSSCPKLTLELNGARPNIKFAKNLYLEKSIATESNAIW